MKRTNHITITTREYERLTRAEAMLDTIVNAQLYNLSHTVEAVKAAIETADNAVSRKEPSLWIE